MGYTHYIWQERKLDRKAFSKAAADCLKVCNAASVPLANGAGDPGSRPTFTATEITFNGLGEDSYETFSLKRIFKCRSEQPDKNGKLFSFCKTAQKHYDIAVCVCLIVLKHHLGNAIRIQSDGRIGEDGWTVALDLCQRILGYGGDFTLDSSTAGT